MTRPDIGSLTEDRVLERVPDGERESRPSVARYGYGLSPALVRLRFGVLTRFMAVLFMATFGVGGAMPAASPQS